MSTRPRGPCPSSLRSPPIDMTQMSLHLPIKVYTLLHVYFYIWFFAFFFKYFFHFPKGTGLVVSLDTFGIRFFVFSFLCFPDRLHFLPKWLYTCLFVFTIDCPIKASITSWCELSTCLLAF
jgi:hypothetical protein